MSIQDVETTFDGTPELSYMRFASLSANTIAQTLLPEWSPFNLHPHILRSIHSQGFDKPTPIQIDAIPFALEGRGIVGVAETVRSTTSPLPHKWFKSSFL